MQSKNAMIPHAAHSSLDVVALCREYHDGFEAFVSQQAAGIVYYSLRYKQFLESLLGCEPRYWLATDENGHIVGVLPLMKAHAADGRAVLNSLPFYGSHGGILAESAAAFDALVDKYRDEAGSDDVVAATMIENPFRPLNKAIPATFIDWRISQITDVDMPEDQLLASFEGSARRNIKKAKREGVSVHVDNDAWDFLERVHCDNMHAIGGKAKNQRFFQILPSVFRAGIDYKIFIAEVGNKHVAALLLLYYCDTVEYFVPATMHETRGAQALPLVILHAMVDARTAGFKRWNWGGTWLSQSGVYRFKKKFAAAERKYRYFIELRDKRLLRESSEALSRAFPDFYVVPFDRLDGADATPS